MSDVAKPIVNKANVPTVVKAGAPKGATPSTAVAPLGRVALISLGIGILVSLILLFVPM
jgi:hypothetical protein